MFQVQNQAEAGGVLSGESRFSGRSRMETKNPACLEQNVMIPGDPFRGMIEFHDSRSFMGRRAKGDAGKLALAVRLRAETEMTVKWIAERLEMGAAGYVHHLLYRRWKADQKAGQYNNIETR
jgi:hypothetical protein